MKVSAKIKQVLLSLTLLAVLLSCTEDAVIPRGSSSARSGVNKEVSVVVKVPGSSSSTTRALGEETDDAEVVEVVVMQFTTGHTGQNAGKNTLRFATKSTSASVTPGGTLTFNVKLLTGNYNIVVLANSNGIYDKVKDAHGGDLRGKTYDYLQAQLTKAVKGSDGEGDKWNTTVNSQKDYLIPMWGMKSNVDITHDGALQTVQTVYLFRMLAKVDVRVQRSPGNGYDGVSEQDFRLTHVSFHNYNRTGLIMAGLGNGNWEAPQAPDRKATEPSLLNTEDKVTGYTHCQTWTTMTEEYDALEGEIFTFEASAGTDFSDRACIIIGGYYNWDGVSPDPETCYYRIDMVDVSGGYFNIMRNYKYNVVIRKVKGAGYPDVETAYKSKPTNVTAEVIPWNDGEYTDGIWEGMNEISFTSRNAFFSQFGTPENQIFKVRTTAEKLTFDSFRSGPVDNNSEVIWTESPAGSGKWSNGHFTVEISAPTTSGVYTEHQIKINAAPTVVNNRERKAYFNVTALNLKATFTITQSEHVTYKLLTNPDRNHVFLVDGNSRRIPVEVTSTHPYVVDWDSDGVGMLDGVYLYASGGTNLKGQDIDQQYEVVYVAINELSDNVGLRAGEFHIKHGATTGSNLGPSDFTIVQKKPVISASLVTGESNEIQKEGGSVRIKVESNMNAWVPILKINGVEETGVSKYFGISGGSGNAEVTFTAEAMSDSETTDKEFTITFRDASAGGTTESMPPIIITQIAKLPGSGSGGQQPGSGMDAIPGILAVNSKGQLNLDGDGYLVYFKFGSLIATWSREYGDVFDVTDVAWTPDGLDYEALIANIGTKKAEDAWKFIPYAGSPYCNMSDKPGSGAVADYAGFPDYPDDLPQNISKGLGDPCKYAYAKSGKKYRTPKGGNHTEGNVEYDLPPPGPMNPDDKVSGINGRWYNKDLPDAQFYPAGGVREAANGRVDRPGWNLSHYTYFGGYFWCSRTETPGSTSTNRGSALRFKFSNMEVSTIHPRHYGYLIRCMEDK